MDGYGRGLGAGAGVELGEDRTDVVVNRLRRDEQAVGDLAVAQPVGNEREDGDQPVWRRDGKELLQVDEAIHGDANSVHTRVIPPSP